jgi:hypothetical protein
MNHDLAEPTLADTSALLLTGEPPELGRGPRPDVRSVAELDAVLAALPAGPTARRATLRALILLWHDHWDAAHAMVQDLPDADAAYVHGIVHRREPDYWNAKYWFRRVTAHPIWPELAGEARARREATPEFKPFDLGGSPGRWEPLTFVDFCEAAARWPITDPRHRFARELQAAEFRFLARHLSGR